MAEKPEVVEKPVGKTKTAAGKPKIFRKEKPKPAPKPEPEPEVWKDAIESLIAHEQEQLKEQKRLFLTHSQDAIYSSIEAIEYHMARITKAKRILTLLEG